MNSIKRWWCKHFHGCTRFYSLKDGQASYHCMVCGRYWVEWQDTWKKLRKEVG